MVADVDDDNGARVVTEITAKGGTASYLHVDVASADDVQAMVAHAVATYGGLHLAVNNAGLGHAPTRLHEIPLETWDRLLAIDLRGVMLCMRAELAHFVEQGGGSIVNMASGTGLKASRGLAAYVTAKHGVVGLTRNGAIDYATDNIRVNAVAPGTILTPQMSSFPAEQQAAWTRSIPMSRMGQPAEIAEAVAYLLSEAAGFVTGTVLEVDGGYMQASPA